MHGDPRVKKRQPSQMVTMLGPRTSRRFQGYPGIGAPSTFEHRNGPISKAALAPTRRTTPCSILPTKRGKHMEHLVTRPPRYNMERKYQRCVTLQPSGPTILERKICVISGYGLQRNPIGVSVITAVLPTTSSKVDRTEITGGCKNSTMGTR